MATPGIFPFTKKPFSHSHRLKNTSKYYVLLWLLPKSIVLFIPNLNRWISKVWIFWLQIHQSPQATCLSIPVQNWILSVYHPSPLNPVPKPTFPVLVNCTTLHPNAPKSALPSTLTEGLPKLTPPHFHTDTHFRSPGPRSIFPESEGRSPGRSLSKNPPSKFSFGKDDHLLHFWSFTV